MAERRIRVVVDGQTGTMPESEYVRGRWWEQGVMPADARPSKAETAGDFLWRWIPYRNEMAAGLYAAAPSLDPGYSGPSGDIKSRYTSYRDYLRGKEAAHRSASIGNPKTATISEIAGGIIGLKGASKLIPGLSAPASGESALQRGSDALKKALPLDALMAHSRSESPDLKGQAADVASGVIAGAPFAAGLGAMTPDPIPPPVQGAAYRKFHLLSSSTWWDPEAVKDEASDARIKTLRPAAGQARDIEQSVPGGLNKVGRTLNEAKNPYTGKPLLGFMDEASDIAEKVPVLKDKVGSEVGGALTRADAAGASFDTDAFFNRARQIASELKGSANAPTRTGGEKLASTIDDYQAKYAPPRTVVGVTRPVATGRVGSPSKPDLAPSVEARPGAGYLLPMASPETLSTPPETPFSAATRDPRRLISGTTRPRPGSGWTPVFSGPDTSKIPLSADTSPLSSQGMKNELHTLVDDLSGNMDTSVPSYRQGAFRLFGPLNEGQESAVESALGPQVAADYKQNKRLYDVLKVAGNTADSTRHRGSGAATPNLGSKIISSAAANAALQAGGGYPEMIGAAGAAKSLTERARIPAMKAYSLSRWGDILDRFGMSGEPLMSPAAGPGAAMIPAAAAQDESRQDAVIRWLEKHNPTKE